MLRASRAAHSGHIAIVAIVAMLSTASAQPAPAPDAAFMAENATAMDRMMVGMTVSPSGDVDRDFVAMMVPHHQGAIDMALAELRYGTNETLRRIAQEIIVTQQQEIEVMRRAVPPTADPAPAPEHRHMMGDHR